MPSHGPGRLPGDLEAKVEAFNKRYNQNVTMNFSYVTPADTCFGGTKNIEQMRLKHRKATTS